MAGRTAHAPIGDDDDAVALANGVDRSGVTARTHNEEDSVDERPADLARLDTVIDGFRIVERLGRGGAASVYRAVHEDGRAVAMKILHPEHSGDGRARKRLLREAYVANRIGHPSVPQVLGDGITTDGAGYLVLELCTGETLQVTSNATNGGMDWENVARWMDELLDVLAVAHDLHIVHRDIKPGNLLVTSEGRLKVLDFGIARITDVSEVSSLVTKTGAVLGTPHFMPPEQAIGNSDEIDARSDIWSVGATMFTLLTGRYVHPARNVNEAIVLAATQKASRIESVKPDVPAALAAVVDRALSFKRSERFANAREMQDALRRAMRGETLATTTADSIETLPEEAVPLPRVPVGNDVEDDLRPELFLPRKTRWPWLLAMGGIIAATTTAFFLRSKPHEEPRPEVVTNELAAPRPSTLVTASAPIPQAAPINDIPAASATSTAMPSAIPRAMGHVDKRNVAESAPATPSLPTAKPASTPEPEPPVSYDER